MSCTEIYLKQKNICWNNIIICSPTIVVAFIIFTVTFCTVSSWFSATVLKKGYYRLRASWNILANMRLELLTKSHVVIVPQCMAWLGAVNQVTRCHCACFVSRTQALNLAHKLKRKRKRGHHLQQPFIRFGSPLLQALNYFLSSSRAVSFTHRTLWRLQ